MLFCNAVAVSSQQCWHVPGGSIPGYYGGNKRCSAFLRYWMFPRVPSDFTGAVAGNRRYSTSTQCSTAVKVLATIYATHPLQTRGFAWAYGMTSDTAMVFSGMCLRTKPVACRTPALLGISPPILVLVLNTKCDTGSSHAKRFCRH